MIISLRVLHAKRGGSEFTKSCCQRGGRSREGEILGIRHPFTGEDGRGLEFFHSWQKEPDIDSDAVTEANCNTSTVYSNPSSGDCVEILIIL